MAKKLFQRFITYMFIKKIIPIKTKAMANALKFETPVTKPGSLFSKSSACNVDLPPMSKQTNYLRANTYKDRCIQSVNSNNPREVAFLLDNDTGVCLGEFQGDAGLCEISAKSLKSKLGKHSFTLMHSHPPIEGVPDMSLPVSLQDFEVMNNTDISKLIAYNAKGEYSSLKKSCDYVPLDKASVKELKKEYFEFLLNNSDPTETQKLKELLRYTAKNPNASAVKHEIAQRMTALQFKQGADRVIDSFWSKFAEKIKLIYSTNFSNLR